MAMSTQKEHGVSDVRHVPLDDPRVFLRDASGRLSMSCAERVVIGTVASSALCFTAGIFQEWPISALRFRAENAHRMPKSEKGWYFYHRHKTNYAAHAAMKVGIRSALQYGPATGIVLYTEHVVDVLRGGRSKDFISTVIAAVTVTGCYSLLKRHPVATASHTLKIGFLFGLGYGLAQDALSIAHGRPLAYIEFMKRLFSGLRQQDLKRDSPVAAHP